MNLKQWCWVTALTVAGSQLMFWYVGGPSMRNEPAMIALRYFFLLLVPTLTFLLGLHMDSMDRFHKREKARRAAYRQMLIDNGLYQI